LDGVTFDTLTPMNEPGSDWWHFGGRQEGTHMSHDQEARMIKQLRLALDRCRLKTGLVASEDNDEQRTINAVAAYDPATRQMLAHVATHTYTANNPAGICRLATAVGKTLWITEYGDGEGSGLRLARRIRDDIVQTHASAWIYWQFAEPDSNWGLVRYHREDPGRRFSINRKFYMMSQFSCFIRPGCQILDPGDGNSLVAYDSAGHRLILVTVNDHEYPLTVGFSLGAFRVHDGRVSRWRTSDIENMEAVDSVALLGGRFESTLPPRSVTTQVIAGAFLPAPSN
jgi:O-glycosyl hydrolase